MIKTLLFSQPKALQYAFIIEENDTQIGSLSYKKFAHRQANAVINGKEWKFAKKGIIHNKILAYQGGSEEPAAIYSRSLIKSKGKVTLNSKEYFLQKEGILHSKYVWTDQQDVDVITYVFGGVFKTKGEITILDSNEIPWELLVLLGLFAGLDTEEDGASATASGGSGG